jgi:hypothetical protein
LSEHSQRCLYTTGAIATKLSRYYTRSEDYKNYKNYTRYKRCKSYTGHKAVRRTAWRRGGGCQRSEAVGPAGEAIYGAPPSSARPRDDEGRV